MYQEKQESEFNTPDPLVSVIIPFYNSEKWISETIDSLLCQTLQNIEIICVDDGSTDTSADLIKSYCTRDPRIKYYWQENTGTGSARNKGMSVAKGKYLSFLDADDIYDPNMLKAMSDALEKSGAEICICEAERFDMKTGKTSLFPVLAYDRENGVYPTTSLQSALFQMPTLAPWNKLFLHSFIKEHDLQFQNQPWLNDCYFVSCALAYSTNIYVLNEVYVHYRCNMGTSLQDKKGEHPLCGMDAWYAIRGRLLKEDVLTIEGRRSLDIQCFDSFFSYFRRFVNDEEASKIIYEQLKYKLIKEMKSNDDPYEYFSLKKKLKLWSIERISLKGLRRVCRPMGDKKRYFSIFTYKLINVRLFIASLFYKDKETAS